jgi:hypothetical protein
MNPTPYKLTKKETNQLNVAIQESRAAWSAACVEAGVPIDIKFVVFSNASDLAKRHNELMGKYFSLVKRISKNAARRERHATLKSHGAYHE